MNLEDTLSDLTADLVASNEPFMERLLTGEAGRWEEVATLCAEFPEPLAKLAVLEEPYQGDLRVTWLDYPDSSYGPGYCVVLFYSEGLNWRTVAIFNQHLFVERRAGRADSAS
jgi:hypothetical protein